MNCDNEAVALLTFAPRQAKAWLYDLVEADPTGGLMLCRKHANATVVPMSWQLVDARDPAWPGPAAPVSTTAPMVDASYQGPLPNPAPAGFDPYTAGHIAPPSSAVPAPATPSDNGQGLNAFAGPVASQPYAEPRVATLRAAGVLADTSPVAAPADADMSLFQLPITDTPAVTPYNDRSSYNDQF